MRTTWAALSTVKKKTAALIRPHARIKGSSLQSEEQPSVPPAILKNFERLADLRKIVQTPPSQAEMTSAGEEPRCDPVGPSAELTAAGARGRYCRGVPSGAGDETIMGTGVSPPVARVIRDHAEKRGIPLAPMFRCPLCPGHVLEESTGAGGHRDGATWLTPQQITAHMNRFHPTDGYTPAQLQGHNADMLSEVVKRLAVPFVSTTEGKSHTTTTTATTRDDVLVDEAHVSPARLILLLDVANLEMSTGSAITDLLLSQKLSDFFSAFPVVVCAVQEIFLPHTLRTSSVFYQLSQLHEQSDYFTFYAVSNLEAGDMVSASIVGGILRRMPPRACPPIVLFTMDHQQKMCMLELYGSGTMEAFAPPGSMHTTSKGISSHMLLHVLRNAISSGYSV